MTRTYALIGGGGTGGHIVPALAIGRALVAAGHPADTIHFVGSRRGMEARLVPQAGFAITLLPGRGVARRLTWANVGAVAGIVAAMVLAVAEMLRRRPAVAVSVGGYAGWPVAVAAVLCRVPLVIAEQNAVPGAANRIIGRWARAAAVSFPDTPLPRSTLTGNPVRPEILAEATEPDARARARAALGMAPDRVVVAAYGGSLGSRTINEAVAGVVERWRDRDDVAFRHVVGRRDWNGGTRWRALAGETGQAGDHTGRLRYQPVEYEDRMPELLAAADIAVSRAGGSVAELAVLGVPSVLVPLPSAPGDHQTANGNAFAAAGAAVLVPDAECTPDRLAEVLGPLIEDKGRRERMAGAARLLARPGAAAAVAELVQRHARRGHPGSRKVAGP